LKRKKLYTFFAIIILVGVYGYEFYLNNKEKNAIVEQGKIVKENTNEYFLPTSTTGEIVHHKGYSLSYNEVHEQAEWVAYELKKSQLSNSKFERPYFQIDRAVSTGAADWRNYKNSGYDRGHLCPAGDRNYSEEAYNETFLTSNITPQKHEFNAGIWNTLEQKIRYWASKYDGVFVVTGGILNTYVNTIGEEEVSIPEQFYKIVLDNNKGKIRVIAFLIPHENSNQPLYNFVVSVDEVESLTGIDFFSDLDDTIENKIEASRSYKNWSFN
jgi:endonuclease G